MACRIGTTGEVEQDFGLAHFGERGVIWKRDGHGLNIKEKQAQAMQRLRGMGECRALILTSKWVNQE